MLYPAPIKAACSFSVVIPKTFYSLVLILLLSYKLSIFFHPRYSLGLTNG
nr:MAG TPA: hypothetical protein [Caudoviricetes sp.]